MRSKVLEDFYKKLSITIGNTEMAFIDEFEDWCYSQGITQPTEREVENFILQKRLGDTAVKTVLMNSLGQINNDLIP